MASLTNKQRSVTIAKQDLVFINGLPGYQFSIRISSVFPSYPLGRSSISKDGSIGKPSVIGEFSLNEITGIELQLKENTILDQTALMQSILDQDLDFPLLWQVLLAIYSGFHGHDPDAVGSYDPIDSQDIFNDSLDIFNQDDLESVVKILQKLKTTESNGLARKLQKTIAFKSSANPPSANPPSDPNPPITVRSNRKNGK